MTQRSLTTLCLGLLLSGCTLFGFGEGRVTLDGTKWFIHRVSLPKESAAILAGWYYGTKNEVGKVIADNPPIPAYNIPEGTLVLIDPDKMTTDKPLTPEYVEAMQPPPPPKKKYRRKRSSRKPKPKPTPEATGSIQTQIDTEKNSPSIIDEKQVIRPPEDTSEKTLEDKMFEDLGL